MLGLGQRASLRRRVGVSGGKPLYGEPGAPFPCRVEPVQSAEAGGQRVAGRRTVRLFAGDMEIGPGDLLVLPGGGEAIVTEVARHVGPAGVHHIEVTAVGADGHG